MHKTLLIVASTALFAAGCITEPDEVAPTPTASPLSSQGVDGELPTAAGDPPSHCSCDCVDAGGRTLATNPYDPFADEAVENTYGAASCEDIDDMGVACTGYVLNRMQGGYPLYVSVPGTYQNCRDHIFTQLGQLGQCEVTWSCGGDALWHVDSLDSTRCVVGSCPSHYEAIACDPTTDTTTTTFTDCE